MSLLDTHLSPLLSLELKRSLSLKMQEAGISTAQICEVLSVSDKFVSKWKIRYPQEGLACLPVQHGGRTSYLNSAERAEVLKHISEQSHYSLPELVAYIHSNYGVTFKSKQSYYDLLSSGGLSWHKTQKSNPKKDEEAILEKRAEIKKNWTRNAKRLKKGKL